MNEDTTSLLEPIPSTGVLIIFEPDGELYTKTNFKQFNIEGHNRPSGREHRSALNLI